MKVLDRIADALEDIAKSLSKEKSEVYDEYERCTQCGAASHLLTDDQFQEWNQMPQEDEPYFEDCDQEIPEQIASRSKRVKA